MRTPWKTGVVYSSRIYVKNAAGAAVTGLVSADFTTKQLSLNDANSAVVVTVTEIDAVNLPGHYKVTFTPNAAGFWHVRVAHPTHQPLGWQDEIQVTDLGLGYSSASEILTALLDIASTIDNVTLRGALRLIVASAAGAGAGTASKPFKSLDGTKDRIASTFDSDGARGTVTKDVT